MTPETLDKTDFEEAAPPAGAPVEEKDARRVPQRAPPRKGKCRRCGQDKPVNGLMLCYPCWVKTVLEERGWREGMPHPDWCHCVGLPGHSRPGPGD